MARLVKPLTATQVLNAKPKETVYKLFDGGGLYLQVTPAGGKHWKMKYRQANGKEGLLSFGAYPAVSLEQARKKREAARAQKASGSDPGAVKRQEKTENEVQEKHSFRSIANAWLEIVAAKVKPQTFKQYKMVMDNHLMPALGDMHIKQIKPADLLQTIRRIEARNIFGTSKKAAQLCSSVLQYAIAMGIIEIDPIPSIRILLKPHRVVHRAACIEPEEFGKILHTIQSFCGTLIVQSALRIMPYIFVRTTELTNARWADIDFNACEWRYTVSKTNTAHIVPLAPQVMAILKILHVSTGKGTLLFPNLNDSTRPISEVTMIAAMRRMGIRPDQMTIHGFRASARTLLDEVLGERYDLIEHQLAHAVRDPNGRAYNRTQHLAERKRMMERWANYIDELRENARLQHADTNQNQGKVT